MVGAAHRESNFRMSACEYDAPMIFLLSYGCDVFDVVRQKGDADLGTVLAQRGLEAGDVTHVERSACIQLELAGQLAGKRELA